MLGKIVTNKSVTIYVKSKKVVEGETSVTEPHLVSPSRGGGLRAWVFHACVTRGIHCTKPELRNNMVTFCRMNRRQFWRL